MSLENRPQWGHGIFSLLLLVVVITGCSKPADPMTDLNHRLSSVELKSPASPSPSPTNLPQAEISLFQSTLSFPTASIVAGTTATATLVLKDSSGNLILDDSRANELIFTVGTAGMSSGTFGNVSAVSGSPGTYQVALTGTTAGSSNIIQVQWTGVGNFAATPSFRVVTGPVSPLFSLVTASPGTITANGNTPSTLTVNLRDAYSNWITGKTVSLASDRASDVISAQNATTDSFGLARFTVKSTLAGVARLTAAVPADTLTIGPTSLTFLAGTATRMVFQTQAAGPASAGTPFSTQPAILVTDSNGNGVPNTAVSLSPYTNAGCTALAGGTVKNSTTTTGASGLASFTQAAYTKTENLYLKASSGTLTVCSDIPVNVIPAAASKLAFRVQPATVKVGFPISPSIEVEIQDLYGNLVPSSPDTITLGIGNNPASASLSGTLSKNTTSGIASFSDLSLDTADVGYTLVAVSTAGITTATSSAIAVMALQPTKISWNGPARAPAYGCHACNVNTLDGKNNPTTVNDSVDIEITGQAGANFYTNNTCTTPLPMNGAGHYHLVMSNVSSARFYLKDQNLETLQLTADDGAGGMSAASLNITVYPAVSSGEMHSCAAGNAGVKCWGFNNSGSLGNGTTTNSSSPVIALAAGTGASLIVGGGGTGASAHTCAIVNSGVWCWGSNNYGQLGDGTTTIRKTPIPVPGLSSGATSLALAGGRTCAVIEGGVKCWGHNGSGALGNGSTTASKTPVVAIPANSGATKVVAGYSHMCAVINEGVKCWGSNTYGELGNATLISSSTPVAVTGLASGVIDLATNNNDYRTCAIVKNTTSNELKCWGLNIIYGGEDDEGYPMGMNSSVPLSISWIGTGITAATLGNGFSCALINGGVKCWGTNSLGQLGTGNLISSPFAAVTTIPENSGVLDLTAGYAHVCASLASGAVRCWGYGYYGQIGNGATTVQKLPTDVLNLPW